MGTYPSGASPFGCLDMAGNAWQWTSSWYDRYPGNTTTNDSFGQKYRMLRGGAWNLINATYFRGAVRSWILPVYRIDDVGFRVARSAP